jgi:formate hydrogenlyase subunit 6/NADH:ubiquinone oxidoreductase subunit I
MILKKKALADFLRSLGRSYQVFGPKQEGGEVRFGPADGEVLLDYQNSRLSPKEFFFPQSERMFEFNADPKAEDAFLLKERPADLRPRLLFGIRPCDAKAFAVLDKIYGNDQYTDTYWFDKREATTLIGLACNRPCATCFCTSVGCGPFHEEGLDVLAVDLGEDILLRPLTDKGEKALEAAGDLAKAGKKAAASAKALKTEAESSITSHVDMDKVNERTVMELFEAGHWAKVAQRCLNCGVCTYVCPTCHCFDIQDEVSGKIGDRVRNWDSCMSWLFTQHGTGHNPRPDKTSRVRQRFMHKFKYIPLKRGGDIGCVGCGRCVVQCPVNIDVRDVVRDMNA